MSKFNSKNIISYLQKYAQAIDLTHFPINNKWQHVLILPVCGESNNCIETVLKNHQESSVLLILILNRPLKHPKSDLWSHENELLKASLYENFSYHLNITDEHILYTHQDFYSVLLLDFNELPFHHNDGVGLARRIGADTACALIAKKIIIEPWIFSTDADVELPHNYFKVISDKKDSVALSLPFDHVTNNIVLAKHQAIYDFKLKYYQMGVKYIGAAYDYIPLGSTIVVNAEAYAKVRGFPRRSGGEDFYLLNKLAKIGKIEKPVEPVVKIAVRQSDRVPFGTGPAVIKIEQQIDSNTEITFYHPQIFLRLKLWHEEICRYYSNQLLPSDQVLNKYWKIKDVLTKAQQNANSETRWQQFIHEWFDAFKILKSVHYLPG